MFSLQQRKVTHPTERNIYRNYGKNPSQPANTVEYLQIFFSFALRVWMFSFRLPSMVRCLPVSGRTEMWICLRIWWSSCVGNWQRAALLMKVICWAEITPPNVCCCFCRTDVFVLATLARREPDKRHSVYYLSIDNAAKWVEQFLLQLRRSYLSNLSSHAEGGG